MPYVMRYERWLTDTEVRFKPRSKQLVAIDEALQDYQQTKREAALKDLKIALQAWKLYKGLDSDAGKPAWVLSDRNRKKAVEQLDLQVFGIQQIGLDHSVLADLAELPYYGIEYLAEEEEAKRILREARRDAVKLLFTGRTVDAKKLGLAKVLHGIKKKLDDAKGDASKAAGAGAALAAAAVESKIPQPAIVEQAKQLAMQMLNALGQIPEEVVNEAMALLASLIPNLLLEIAHSALPYVSAGASGILTAKNGVQTVVAAYNLETSASHLEAFDKRDPFAAAVAVRRMLERELNHRAQLTAIYGLDTAIKSTAIALDSLTLGVPSVSAVTTPLSGFGKSLAIFLLRFYSLCRDLKEKHRANKLLAKAANEGLTAQLFEECPLLGCYFIACTDKSNVINFVVEDIGAHAWMRDVESMITKHIDPMIDLARNVISDSMLEVSGLGDSKGVVASSDAGEYGVSNIKTRLKKQAIAKFRARCPFVDNPKVRPVTTKVGLSPKVLPLNKPMPGFGSRV